MHIRSCFPLLVLAGYMASTHHCPTVVGLASRLNPLSCEVGLVLVTSPQQPANTLHTHTPRNKTSLICITLCLYIYICILESIILYIYMLTPPSPPHDPVEPAFRKQWIMGGGQPPMRKHRQGSNFPQIPEACNAKNIGRDQISPKFPKSEQLWPPHSPIHDRILGIWGRFDPASVFAF